ncbi:hypothetical protein J4E85_006200 [Alternaria conjuncta]|uniref:uncharacterized protein n=1 Tax=Alternaria conjuncta TaxID=181017 RepID=UPI0022202D16|nr:uncharacterized protein J4E85_006200 [Alternaria conjuncta]KAI4927688.1 hypothetical protein J4E85_006200 [Alternaria conjuncta]
MATPKATRGDVKKAMSFDPSKLVTVIVGKGLHQERFSIHEEIVCARSEFFKRALNGKWTESKERIVRLPEDDPKTFGIYTNLVYTGLVLTDTLEEPKTSTLICDEYDKLIKLYVLGEKLQDKAAKNSAIQSLLEVTFETDAEGMGYIPRGDTVCYLYQGTYTGSLGRQLITDSWMQVSTDYLSRVKDGLPKDFLVDLAIALLGELPKKKPRLVTMANKSKYLENMD